jgi:Mor family transcriptional regulator
VILELIILVQREIGRPLAPDARIRIIAELAARYGGRRIYVPMPAPSARKDKARKP